MSVNIIATSVGNTRTQLAAFVDESITNIQRVDNDAPDQLHAVLLELNALMEDVEDPAVLIASVNDEVADAVEKRVNSVVHYPVIRIERDLNVPVGRRLDPESIVGDDRLLNAAAAFDRTKQACIVVDAGTAITVDFVDGEGTFHGGAILPGAQMMLDSMHQGTDQLPELEFVPPAEPIGHNTIQAMLSGVFHGIRGAIRGLAEAYAMKYGAYPTIIATGGDAEVLFKDDEFVEQIVPEISLLGLAIARRFQLAEMAGE